MEMSEEDLDDVFDVNVETVSITFVLRERTEIDDLWKMIKIENTWIGLNFNKDLQNCSEHLQWDKNTWRWFNFSV